MRLRSMTGRRFGRLVVYGRAPNRGRSVVYWTCHCDPQHGGCGKWCEVMAGHLRNGRANSCGCKRAEIGRKKLSDAYWKKCNDYSGSAAGTSG